MPPRALIVRLALLASVRHASGLAACAHFALKGFANPALNTEFWMAGGGGAVRYSSAAGYALVQCTTQNGVLWAAQDGAAPSSTACVASAVWRAPTGTTEFAPERYDVRWSEIWSASEGWSARNVSFACVGAELSLTVAVSVGSGSVNLSAATAALSSALEPAAADAEVRAVWDDGTLRRCDTGTAACGSGGWALAATAELTLLQPPMAAGAPNTGVELDKAAAAAGSLSAAALQLLPGASLGGLNVSSGAAAVLSNVTLLPPDGWKGEPDEPPVDDTPGPPTPAPTERPPLPPAPSSDDQWWLVPAIIAGASVVVILLCVFVTVSLHRKQLRVARHLRSTRQPYQDLGPGSPSSRGYLGHSPLVPAGSLVSSADSRQPASSPVPPPPQQHPELHYSATMQDQSPIAREMDVVTAAADAAASAPAAPVAAAADAAAAVHAAPANAAAGASPKEINVEIDEGRELKSPTAAMPTSPRKDGTEAALTPRVSVRSPHSPLTPGPARADALPGDLRVVAPAVAEAAGVYVQTRAENPYGAPLREAPASCGLLLCDGESCKWKKSALAAAPPLRIRVCAAAVAVHKVPGCYDLVTSQRELVWRHRDVPALFIFRNKGEWRVGDRETGRAILKSADGARQPTDCSQWLRCPLEGEQQEWQPDAAVTVAAQPVRLRVTVPATEGLRKVPGVYQAVPGATDRWEAPKSKIEVFSDKGRWKVGWPTPGQGSFLKSTDEHKDRPPHAVDKWLRSPNDDEKGWTADAGISLSDVPSCAVPPSRLTVRADVLAEYSVNGDYELSSGAVGEPPVWRQRGGGLTVFEDKGKWKLGDQSKRSGLMKTAAAHAGSFPDACADWVRMPLKGEPDWVPDAALSVTSPPAPRYRCEKSLFELCSSCYAEMQSGRAWRQRDGSLSIFEDASGRWRVGLDRAWMKSERPHGGLAPQQISRWLRAPTQKGEGSWVQDPRCAVVRGQPAAVLAVCGRPGADALQSVFGTYSIQGGDTVTPTWAGADHRIFSDGKVWAIGHPDRKTWVRSGKHRKRPPSGMAAWQRLGDGDQWRESELVVVEAPPQLTVTAGGRTFAVSVRERCVGAPEWVGGSCVLRQRSGVWEVADGGAVLLRAVGPELLPHAVARWQRRGQAGWEDDPAGAVDIGP